MNMETMTTIKGQRCKVIITYKKMRSVRLKVRDGMILVSCPYGTSLRFIEQLVQKNADFLLNSINEYSPPVVWGQNGYVDLFGSRYRLVVIDDHRGYCSIDGDHLIVHGTNISVLEHFLTQQLTDYLYEKVNEYRRTFTPVLPMPEIVMKNYKASWGKCYFERNKVCFNNYLVHVDKRLIDYVVVHELCHFLHHNHSQRFYNEIGKRMPDYRERIKELKEISL